ncbi:MAG: iron chelate uptake ABC transporter family permease subunit [Erysipelotrichaceae bacterium]|nr:iron chelate uptake ABC transporter family permease subunit [Erysipelotrichaceae bacterium]
MKKRGICLIILFVLSILSLNIGVKEFHLLDLLMGKSSDVELAILSRIPRLLSILVTGASLSIAGLIMQTITNNKFVSPSTAGTMEWCRFGVMLAILLFGSQSSFFKMLIAFITAFLGTILFMKVLSKIKYKDAVLVPLIGMMMGSVVSSITTFFAYRFDIIQNMSSWLQGDFSLVIKGSYELLYLGIPFLILACIYSHHFTIAGMGESFSKNLGLNHQKIVMLGLIIVGLITSTTVVTVGSISFIGLIIPNIISIYKGDNLKHTLFDTAMVGAGFLLICDMIGRVLIAPYEIPISVIVSVIGSFLYLLLILRRKVHA